MIKLINSLLMLGVLVSGFYMYSLEHSKRSAQREIVQIKAKIAEREENIKLLVAEWSSLTRPERIEMLAKKKLGLGRVTVEQFETPEKLAARIAAIKSAFDAEQAEELADLMQKSE